jgi:hypothetical protein
MPFYEHRDLPLSSTALLTSRAEALSYPKGHLRLGFCGRCGFIQNQLYDARHLEYNLGETAAATANQAGDDALAEELIERYNLRGKSLLEIGCGSGAFLELLCRKGGNLGTGIDPAAPTAPASSFPVEYLRDFYGVQHLNRHADFLYCRHTLEEIAPVHEFAALLRRSAGHNREPVVFCETGDVRRMLVDAAPWDFTYEHCSYFSAGSLSRLFRGLGFGVFDLRRSRDERSLLIDAVISSGDADPAWEIEHDLAELPLLVAYFRDHSATRLHHWTKVLQRVRNDGGRLVLWGAGSRAVNFITSLDAQDDIEFVIDPEPCRQGRFLATTGQEIAPPELLGDYRPDLIIAMDHDELPSIEAELRKLDITAEVQAIQA